MRLDPRWVQAVLVHCLRPPICPIVPARMDWLARLLIVVALTTGSVCVQAQTLTVADRASSRTYDLRELLANAATRDVTVANDVAYRRPMSYRAIAVADLLKTLTV